MINKREQQKKNRRTASILFVLFFVMTLGSVLFVAFGGHSH